MGIFGWVFYCQPCLAPLQAVDERALAHVRHAHHPHPDARLDVPVAAVVAEEGEQGVRAHTLGGGHGRQLLGLEVHLGVAEAARLLGARLEGDRGKLVPATKSNYFSYK